MKAIIFEGITVPLNVIAPPDRKGSAAPIHGALLFYYAAAQAMLDYIRAMLEHSRYDRFIFLTCLEQHRFSLAHLEEIKNSQRDVRILHPTQIASLRDLDRAVLVTANERLGPMLRLRQVLNERIPATGFWHATLPTLLGPILTEMMLGGAANFDALVCPSQRSRKALRSLLELLCAQNDSFPDAGILQTPVIPLAINCSQFPGRNDLARQTFGFAESDVVLLLFGCLDRPAKCDLGPLLLAFSRLKRVSQRTLRLILGGAVSEDFTNSATQFASALGCADALSIQPAASHEEKVKLFGATDVFISAGHAINESRGTTVIEAMACALPCVVPDWNGNCETVIHGQTGFLVPTLWSDLGACVTAFESCGIEPESTLAATTVVDMDSMEHYLKLLIDNVGLRRDIGLSARKHVQTHCDWSVIARQYDDLFDLQRSRAREAGPPAAAHELAFNSSTQRLFRSYPRTALSPDSSVFLTEVGQRWMQAPYRLMIAPALKELINEDLGRRIGEILGASECLTLDELTQTAAQRTGAPPWLIKVNIMRLSKYGIIGCSSFHNNLYREIPTNGELET